jgi:hypothetical protein
MLRWFEYRQVYHPAHEWVASPSDLNRPFEDVYFNATDGIRLNAWFFPADTRSPRAQIVMLVSHGNGGNVSYRVDFCRMLLEAGVSVFVYDYRGYGRSEGRPTEEGTYADAQGAHRWLREKGFAAENIIAVGKSLGGAIAAELALRETVGGLVLQSAFNSIADAGADRFPYLPVRRLHSIKYATLGKLPRVHVPVLVMHNRDDAVIRFSHAEKNFAAANQPKLFWEIEGPHNFREAVSHGLCAQGFEKFLKLFEETAAKARQAAR